MNDTNWEKEKEQVSQELKDNQLFKSLFKAVIELSRDNKELKTHLDNLRDINRVKIETKNNSDPDISPEEKNKKIRLHRMSHAVNEREHLQVYQGQPICNFCKVSMEKWTQKHIYFSCSPRCAEDFEKMVFQSIYSHWTK